MVVVALIPARKGSRRLANKNWAKVGGVPLWVRAIASAKTSGIDHIAVSTDDDEITALALTHGATMVFHQPQFDQSYNVMLEVVKHADRELWTRDIDADAICVLQPTSPLREASDVSACVELIGNAAVDAVVSVTEGEDDVIFRLGHADRLEKLTFPHGRRVRPNGAIFVIKTDLLRAGGYWYCDHAYGYLMPKERSIDVDTALDLELAQMAWDRAHGPRA